MAKPSKAWKMLLSIYVFFQLDKCMFIYVYIFSYINACFKSTITSPYCALTALVIVTVHRKRIDIAYIKLTQLQGLRPDRMERVVKCRSRKGNTGGVDASRAST